MNIADIAQWAVVGILAIGQATILIRNGRSQVTRDSALKAELKADMNNTQKTLSDPNSGLGAIKKSVDDQGKFCGETTGRFDERIKNLEKKEQKAERPPVPPRRRKQ